MTQPKLFDPQPLRAYLALLLSVMAFSTVLAQFGYIYAKGSFTFFWWLAKFFTFFTIIGNTVVGIYALSEAQQAAPKPAKSRDLAPLLYIAVVALVYHTQLRAIWNPQGLQKSIDYFLHSIVPLSMLLYWLLFKMKTQTFSPIMLLQWLYLPIGYFAYLLIFGYFCQSYPYPFLNVNELGYPKVLLSALMLALAMLLLGILFVLLAKAYQYLTRSKA